MPARRPSFRLPVRSGRSVVWSVALGVAACGLAGCGRTTEEPELKPEPVADASQSPN